MTPQQYCWSVDKEALHGPFDLKAGVHWTDAEDELRKVLRAWAVRNLEPCGWYPGEWEECETEDVEPQPKNLCSW